MKFTAAIPAVRNGHTLDLQISRADVHDDAPGDYLQLALPNAQRAPTVSFTVNIDELLQAINAVRPPDDAIRPPGPALLPEAAGEPGPRPIR